MEHAIDPRAYVAAPVLDVRGAVALGRALLSAAPASPGPLVARELDRLGAACGALETAWQPVAADPAPASERRPADHALDGAWAGLHARLAAWERLPGASHPEVGRAEAVRGALFPDGLSFLNLPYERQWAESRRRLDQVDTGELGAQLDALCGPAFLAEVRTAHAHYGAVLGITEALAEPEEVQGGLREPLDAVRGAISRYMRRLVGTLDEDDAAMVAAVRAALRPVEDFRAAVAARASRGGETPAPAPAPAPTL